MGWPKIKLHARFVIIGQETAKQPSENPDNQSHIVGIIIKSQIVCSLRFIDNHDGFFAAVAAFVIAVFTFTLWRSTEKLWEAGEAALKATERAFVFIDGFNVELTTAADAKSIDIDKLPKQYWPHPDLYITRFAVFPRWKNSGNTPTRKMTIQVNWRGPPGPIPPDYVYRNDPDPFFLAPKAVDLSGIVEIPSASQLIDWEMYGRIGDEPMFFIWGRAVYEDIFGREHFVEWCRQLRFDRYDGKTLRASFIQWREYNRTDENN